MKGNSLRLGVLVATTVVVGPVGCGGDQSERIDDVALRCQPPRSTSGPVVVPKVVGQHFDVAVRRLLAKRLLVSVPRFAPFHVAPAEQGWGRLENYRVVAQSPPPGDRIDLTSPVRLTLDAPVFQGPYGSPVVATRRPPSATIPNLVGKTYRQAMSGDPVTTGVYVRIGRTGPLMPKASACGLDGFVVASQSPDPGAFVPWGGVVRGGVNPSLATVTLTLTSVE